MDTEKTIQKESFTVATRLPPGLYREVEAMVNGGQFVNRADFFKAAIRAYIEQRKGQRTDQGNIQVIEKSAEIIMLKLENAKTDEE